MRKSSQPYFDKPPVADAPGDDAIQFPFGHGEPRHALPPLRKIGRPDALMAQHVDVAIVLNAMLGRSAAEDYLKRYEVPQGVIERVLAPEGRRRGTHDANGVRLA